MNNQIVAVVLLLVLAGCLSDAAREPVTERERINSATQVLEELVKEEPDWALVIKSVNDDPKVGNLRMFFGGSLLQSLVAYAPREDVETFIRGNLSDISLHREVISILEIAVRRGDRAIVQAVLDSTPGINVKNPVGYTGYWSALHWAAQRNHADIIETLLQYGFAVDARGFHGETPLQVAAFTGNVESASVLLKGGADINARDRYKGTPLHGLAGGVDYFVPTKEENSPIMTQELLNAGADPNASDRYGWTPLHTAVMWKPKDPSNKYKTVKMLIDAGADVNAQSTNGQTVLQCALLAGDFMPVKKDEIVALLLDRGAQKGPKDDRYQVTFSMLSEVATGDSIDLFNKLLLSNPKLINVRNSNGRTLLWFACESGSADLIRYLLDHGADPNIENFWGGSPLHLAVWSDEIERLQVLIDGGANVNGRDVLNKTPLWISALNHRLKTTRWLLNNGADLNVPDHQEQTVLHVIQDVTVVKILLENGATVDARDEEGMTPLHTAARDGVLLKAKALIAKGADVNATNNQGQSVLHIVMTQASLIIEPSSESLSLDDAQALVTLLCTHGADANLPDGSGFTAKQLAEIYKVKVHF